MLILYSGRFSVMPHLILNPNCSSCFNHACHRTYVFVSSSHLLSVSARSSIRSANLTCMLYRYWSQLMKTFMKNWFLYSWMFIPGSCFHPVLFTVHYKCVLYWNKLRYRETWHANWQFVETLHNIIHLNVFDIFAFFLLICAHGHNFTCDHSSVLLLWIYVYIDLYKDDSIHCLWS